MAKAFPTLRSVGVFVERRTLTCWSTHPGEQENMARNGWIEVATVPDFETVTAADGSAISRPAKLFVKGPYMTGEPDGKPPESFVHNPHTPTTVPEETYDALTPESE